MKQVRELPQAFGKTVAALRVQRGLSQEQLAEAIDASNVYICLLETGQRQPSLNAAILIAESLGVKPSELLRLVCEELQSSKT